MKLKVDCFEYLVDFAILAHGINSTEQGRHGLSSFSNFRLMNRALDCDVENISRSVFSVYCNFLTPACK